jgi:hypothetical protein
MVLRRKRLLTPEEAKAFDERLAAERDRQQREFEENRIRYIQTRNTVQPKIDAGTPCSEEEATLFLSHTEFQSPEDAERAKRLIMEGRFEEGNSVPTEGLAFHGKYPCDITMMGTTSYIRPYPDGSIGGFAFTSDERERYWREKKIIAIRRWEELIASKADPKECRAAGKAVFWAIWSYPKRPFDLDGKRYRWMSSNSKGNWISVTQTPPKRPRKKGSE